MTSSHSSKRMKVDEEKEVSTIFASSQSGTTAMKEQRGIEMPRNMKRFMFKVLAELKSKSDEPIPYQIVVKAYNQALDRENENVQREFRANDRKLKILLRQMDFEQAVIFDEANQVVTVI